MKVEKIKTDQQLKEFSQVMALACYIFSLIGFYKLNYFSPLAISLIVIGSGFLIFGIFKPRLLAPMEKAWMLFAEKLSVVMTFIILSVSYYLLFTPIALLLRVIGRDLLQKKIEKNSKTYWSKLDIQDRFYLPY